MLSVKDPKGELIAKLTIGDRRQTRRSIPAMSDPSWPRLLLCEGVSLFRLSQRVRLTYMDQKRGVLYRYGVAVRPQRRGQLQ